MAASAATTRLLPTSAACTLRAAKCRPFLQVCHARPGRKPQLIQLDDLSPNGIPLAPLQDLSPASPPPSAPQQERRYRQSGGGGGQRFQRNDYYNNGQFNNFPTGNFNRRWSERNNRQYNDIGNSQLYDADGYYLEEPETDEEAEAEPLYVGGKRLWVNQEITANQVRLQTETGESMGVVSLGQALEMAAEEGVDVVCLNDELSPPLCRLVAASKYKFEWERAQKASKKKQRETQVEVKEVRLRPITDTADLETKTRNAQKFLQKGAKVKITMSFTGREQRFKEQGRELLLKLIEDLGTLASLEGPVSVRGSTFSAMLAPLKK